MLGALVGSSCHGRWLFVNLAHISAPWLAGPAVQDAPTWLLSKTHSDFTACIPPLMGCMRECALFGVLAARQGAVVQEEAEGQEGTRWRSQAAAGPADYFGRAWDGSQAALKADHLRRDSSAFMFRICPLGMRGQLMTLQRDAACGDCCAHCLTVSKAPQWARFLRASVAVTVAIISW